MNPRLRAEWEVLSEFLMAALFTHETPRMGLDDALRTLPIMRIKTFHSCNFSYQDGLRSTVWPMKINVFIITDSKCHRT